MKAVHRLSAALAFFLWFSLQPERRGVQRYAEAEAEAQSGP